MVKYVYDAWGKHKVLNPNGTENTTGSFVGNMNPFRYRGYYYDTETWLYYLHSRYYDPEVGRFLSQDDLDYADPETINGLKLGNGARFAVDVLARPMANQLTKMGTRGAEFSFEKYAYNVIIRAATFNIGFGKFSMPMFGSEFSVTFGKSILRGFLSGFGKKYLF